MVRAAQAEDNIREQKRLLDGKKENDPDHPDNATKLAGQQDELRKTVGSCAKTKFDEVKPVLQAAEGLMGEVAEICASRRPTRRSCAQARSSDSRSAREGWQVRLEDAADVRQMLAQATQAKTRRATTPGPPVPCW
jgi:hypothetical protein